ncbi:VOC family protein [Rhodococcus sp. W8901]|uniref:VOC family protein n=1 Tax=Rhodococcus sp. W8901 TaxID=2742603 RepID=UPI0020C618B6|nr:VOC family protein [Rhodococcus sp. W8901]
MTNSEFDITGINHLALVCSDMERTVDFYSNVLGMPLVKTLELPDGGGQHFFFDLGGGNHLAFFWFPDAPPAAPGIAAAVTIPGKGEITSAIGSMNHVAFTIPADKFDEYRAKLKSKGVRVGYILNHDDSESGVASEMHDGVFVRSLYFQDPDGILLEFAAYTRELTSADVRHRPAKAANAAAI